MLKRRSFALGCGITLAGVWPAAAREPATVVIAIPANRSPALQKQLRLDVARLYTDAQPGDRFLFEDASNQKVIKDIIVPVSIGTTDRDRDDALLDLFAPVSRFLAVNDPSAPIDNLNIPLTLRAIGLTVLPRFPNRKAHVVLVGSMIWENPRDATWSFKTNAVLDGFLNERGGSFGVIGEENALSGGLVSILYDDGPSAFKNTDVERFIMEFWGKSIKGRGGRVGAIEAYGPDSYARLFATTEDTTPYVIDTKAPRAIVELGFVRTPVIEAGQSAPKAAGKPPTRKSASHPHHKPTGSRPANAAPDVPMGAAGIRG